MAFESNSQFCDDIDRLIMEEENRMDNVESGDESATNNPKSASKETKKPMKKKTYERYTPEQIKGMQEVFDRKRHPDDDERKALGRELGLHPLRVKFWFQNRRSQTKKERDKELNKKLKEENQRLRSENAAMRRGLANAACYGCGAPANAELLARVEHYKASNDSIKNQISHMTFVMEKIFGKEMVSRHQATSATAAAALPQEAVQRAGFGPEMFVWTNDQDEA